MVEKNYLSNIILTFFNAKSQLTWKRVTFLFEHDFCLIFFEFFCNESLIL